MVYLGSGESARGIKPWPLPPFCHSSMLIISTLCGVSSAITEEHRTAVLTATWPLAASAAPERAPNATDLLVRRLRFAQEVEKCPGERRREKGIRGEERDEGGRQGRGLEEGSVCALGSCIRDDHPAMLRPAPPSPAARPLAYLSRYQASAGNCTAKPSHCGCSRRSHWPSTLVASRNLFGGGGGYRREIFTRRNCEGSGVLLIA